VIDNLRVTSAARAVAEFEAWQDSEEARIERECEKACDADYLLDELGGDFDHHRAIDALIAKGDALGLGQYVLRLRASVLARMVRSELGVK
jgi:hypothetical protein